MTLSLGELMAELRRAWEYTDELWMDLTPQEVIWRRDENSSAIGWHLGHQAAVAHFMVRNLLAAEPSPDPELDAIMDSATPEVDRGDLPSIERLGIYRRRVSERLVERIANIQNGAVGAPDQLRIVAGGLVVAAINHEYQHDQWIGEVRQHNLGKSMPPRPESEYLVFRDDYPVLG